LVFFPSIIQYQVEGIRTWLLSLPAEHRPRVIVNLDWLTFAMPHLQHRSNKEMLALLYRFGLRRLVASHPRTWVCAPTQEMVSQFEALCGIRVHQVPIPVIIEDLQSTEVDSSRVCIAYLGHANPAKGIDLLPEIVRRVSTRKASAHFLIQVYGDPQMCATLQEGLADCPAEAVTLTIGALDPAIYRDFLQRAQIVLLPYAKELYGWASSGIFSEAMSLGKVVVVTPDTWLARQLEKFRGGGVVAAAMSGQDIAQAVEQAAESLPELSRLASMAAPRWKEHHSPSRFVDTVLGLIAESDGQTNSLRA
jgi:glycosyltransferase involved in cell wall biosynthesis